MTTATSSTLQPLYIRPANRVCYTARMKQHESSVAKSSYVPYPNLTDIERVKAMILGNYATHARRFFWRAPEPDPYMVLVSETMLQQTQTARVQEKLPVFLKQFPDFSTLAAADNATVIRAWKGMGYNNRALRLRDCARAVCERFDGRLPDGVEALSSLPGIGPYTAAAILSFAFHEDVVVLDVNVRRLYSRLFQRQSTTLDVLPERVLQSIADEVYPRGRSSDWHQACMDIAAQYCTAHAPRCLFCPVAQACMSAHVLLDTAPPRVAEPSYRGIPNRIWRGKIIDILRGLTPGTVITLTDLSVSLGGVSTPADDAWLGRLLKALERDGLVKHDASADAVCLHP